MGNASISLNHCHSCAMNNSDTFQSAELSLFMFFKQRSGSSSRSGSPKPCPLSRPRNLGGLVAALPSGLANLPAMIHIETAFKRLQTSSSQTFTINNYDGSKTTKTIIKHRDGTETITEVTSYSTGEQVAKEIVRNESTGRARK